MNRCLPQALLVLLFICAACTFFSSTGEALAATAAPAEALNDSEKDYIESKHFPKKGNYSDWLEANKLSNQGVRYARAGRYKSAIPMFQQAIQRYGQDYTYYENLGAALHKTGNLERAESTTEMAAQMAPRHWGPWYNLGLILTKEHEYKRALAALKKAKALRAPASKTVGINRLILALQRKLDDTNSANEAIVESTKEPPATAVAPTADHTSAPSAVGGNSVSSMSNETPAKSTSAVNSTNSEPNQNPYTTVPDVSPVPTPPSIDKGN